MELGTKRDTNMPEAEHAGVSGSTDAAQHRHQRIEGLRRDKTANVGAEDAEVIGTSADAAEHQHQRIVGSRSDTMRTVAAEDTEVIGCGNTAEPLLPRLRNDALTLTHIITKLSWNDVSVCLNISRSWRANTHKIYDRRSRQQCRESILLILPYAPGHEKFELLMASLKTRKIISGIPKIDPLNTSTHWRFLASEGKLFALELKKCEMLFLDIASRSYKWNRCATWDTNMPFPSMCGVAGTDSIIVGRNGRVKLFSFSKNSWSDFRVPRDFVSEDSVGLLQDEYVFYEEYVAFPSIDFTWHLFSPKKFCWRIVKPFQSANPEPENFWRLISFRGKMWGLTKTSLFLYQDQQNLWSKVQNISYGELILKFCITSRFT